MGRHGGHYLDQWSKLDSLVTIASARTPIISVFDWEDSLRYAVGTTYRYDDKWTFRARTCV